MTFKKQLSGLLHFILSHPCM